jgi:hypothetical protein
MIKIRWLAFAIMLSTFLQAQNLSEVALNAITINKVMLSDTPKQLVAKLGKPTKKFTADDTYLKQIVDVYLYGKSKFSFYNNQLSAVDITDPNMTLTIGEANIKVGSTLALVKKYFAELVNSTNTKTEPVQINISGTNAVIQLTIKLQKITKMVIFGLVDG